MRTAYATGRNSPNSRGAISGAKNAKVGPTSRLLADLLREILPAPAWASLEKLLFGKEPHERLVKHRLSKSRAFDVEELAALLRSDHGFTVLSAIMGDAKPMWWRLCAPLMHAADARKLQRQAQQKIQSALRGAFDANDDLRSAIERSEAALSVQDQDFYSPHIDALRAMGRVSHRAVASQAGRGRR